MLNVDTMRMVQDNLCYTCTVDSDVKIVTKHSWTEDGQRHMPCVDKRLHDHVGLVR